MMMAPPIILALAVAFGVDPSVAPTTRVLNCTEAGCHAPQLDRPFLHGPTAVHSCDVCHEFADPGQHKFQLKAQGRDLCTFCHINKTGREGPVVHEPVAKGECLSCHDPHGSSVRSMLRQDSVNGQCAQCHAETLKASHIHQPAGEDCTKCHEAHTSKHERLLTMTPRELCISCHAAVGERAAHAAFPHDPARGDCLSCHTPHATEQIKALKASPRELCVSCHAEVAQQASSATHPHSAVLEGKACLNCHEPHGSDHSKQIRGDGVATCLACHKEPIKVAAAASERIVGGVVAGVPELAQAGMFRHGPIATEDNGGCAACHAVHGGERASLLVGAYSTEFYQRFSDDAYGLCLKCHDRDRLLGESAQAGGAGVVGGMTNFRHGERNLHAVHVDRGDQGRSCRACHTPHASRFPQQIADSVPFGKWSIPINFNPTAVGGSCSPGCHKPYSYERSPTPTPTAQPKP